jgi:glycosyltransferase involved in cell wall biosynthesis
LYPLPNGYGPRAHYRHRKAVAALFRELIPQYRYLCFSNLGWWGAWGSVASAVASRMARPYSVWLDWVLHEMPVQKTSNPARNAMRAAIALVAKRASLRSVRNAALGLFHGRSVYDAYAPYSKVAKVVHDVHLKKDDIIDPIQLKERLGRLGTKERPVQIGYLGRVHPMKGPTQWIEALELAEKQLGGAPRLQATWLGDGPLLGETRALADGKGMASWVSLPGHASDRGAILQFLRDCDLFLFCHLTPESPRCLIEALMSGLPVIGFDSPYARDLVEAHGGGRFAPLGDVAALARLLAQTLQDAESLRKLSLDAFASGSGFSDDVVFRHRSELIKEFL